MKIRIDVVLAFWRKDLGVKTVLGIVQPDGSGRLIDALAAVRFDVGKLGRQVGMHHGRFNNGKPFKADRWASAR